MTTDRVPRPPSPDQPLEFRKKDGSLSKMRSHRGNIPVLPQTKLCPHCPAKFTRTTHLNRHLRTHTNERLHRCDTCDSQFTRSDLLTRHKKSCNDPSNRTRRKSCVACMESKIKCDRQYPCSKCTTRGKECIFAGSGRRSSAAAQLMRYKPSELAPLTGVSATPSAAFAPAPESKTSFTTHPYIRDLTDHIPQAITHASPIHAYAQDGNSPLYDKKNGGSEFYSSPTSDLETVNDAEGVSPVNSHLSSAYSSDMFEPFFSNIFSHPSPSTSSMNEDFSWAEGLNLRPGSPDELPFTMGPGPASKSLNDVTIQLPEALPDPSVLQPALSHMRLEGPAAIEPPAAELQHYLYLFFSAFVVQIPIVHVATFSLQNKPPVLLSAMYACGALFVKTKKAANFISNTLTSAREALVQEFAKNPTNSADQFHLILAVVLLQTIGLFHQQSDQRAFSSIYHGMLVMMIRRTGLISRNASWKPAALADYPLETLWHDWAQNEMTKRALLWSYLHDCCHCIYFALPPSYHPSEIELNLPCEDTLWRANNSTDWFMVLQTPSPYGPSHTRMAGASMPVCMASIVETRPLTDYTPLGPFSHFILIHAILRRLFLVCVETRMPRGPGVDGVEEVNQEVFALQYALHNWLQSWRNSPELPKIEDVGEEPVFSHNALPFYWLGQVALLAHQEGLPPFEYRSPNNLKVESRFRLVKQWLKHIRGFLIKTDGVPTIFWDELMKIRIQTWQVELENDTTEDQEGVLGFFPEHL
ncbi:fungal-specific transcription factor domain-containing protein [Infundibulicybe gibba]|nr:fungal-specific transcription factor domain-containing protein [Infundibulicybe gibba]